MKKYDVTLTAHYEKTISVYADSPEEAKEKTEIILFDTDLIDFTDEDFAFGEAAIKVADEDDCEESDATVDALENDECSGCPYLCPVCKECMYEDGCDG